MINYAGRSARNLLSMHRAYQTWLHNYTQPVYYLTPEAARQYIHAIERELLSRVPVKFCWEIEKLMLDLNIRP